MAVTIKGSGQIVVQVKSYTLTTAFSTSSTTPVDMGLTVNITPTDSANRILIFADVMSSTGNQSFFNITRNGTAINQTTVASTNKMSFGAGPNNSTNYFVQSAHSFLDSPATTSSTTYAIYLFTDASTVYVNRRGVDLYDGTTSTITVMEISGT